MQLKSALHISLFLNYAPFSPNTLRSLCVSLCLEETYGTILPQMTLRSLSYPFFLQNKLLISSEQSSLLFTLKPLTPSVWTSNYSIQRLTTEILCFPYPKKSHIKDPFLDPKHTLLLIEKIELLEIY